MVKHSEMRLFLILLVSISLCAGFNLGTWKLTWDAEGTDNPHSSSFSRKLHVPTSSSGLTIGRGYDMKDKSSSTIKRDFLKAGISQKYADIICKASKLRGEGARKFIRDHHLESFLITPNQQLKLFEISIGEKVVTARRICINHFAKTNFDKLHWSIQGLLVDLLYRGDYNHAIRVFIQPAIVANDVKKLAGLMSNAGFWHFVPSDRFNRRKKYMQAAIGH